MTPPCMYMDGIFHVIDKHGQLIKLKNAFESKSVLKVTYLPEKNVFSRNAHNEVSTGANYNCIHKNY